MIDEVQVHGESGPAVLLLPGGAESCDGFFPGLAEGLVDEPGCRIIVHDRPGTGGSTTEGSLADSASALNSLINELGCGPVVVVGQSLGGAVGVLLARDHPENVAGLVLLDPTPINEPRTCARLERSMRVASLPGIRQAFSAIVRVTTRRAARRERLRPDCSAALSRTADLDISKLARAVRGIGDLSAELRELDLSRLPAVVVTADRKADSSTRLAHARLADAFGGSLVCWPGAKHHVHLDHPDDTLAAVRDLVGRVESAA